MGYQSTREVTGCMPPIKSDVQLTGVCGNDVTGDIVGEKSMAYLVYKPLPKHVKRGRDRTRGSFLYEQYVPLMDEFYSSGETSAQVVDEGINGVPLRCRVEAAIFHSKGRKVLSVAMRDGDVYVIRKNVWGD